MNQHLHAAMPEVMALLKALKVDINRPVSKVVLDIQADDWVHIDVTYEIRSSEVADMVAGITSVMERYRLEKIDDTGGEGQSQNPPMVQG